MAHKYSCPQCGAKTEMGVVHACHGSDLRAPWLADALAPMMAELTRIRQLLEAQQQAKIQAAAPPAAKRETRGANSH